MNKTLASLVIAFCCFFSGATLAGDITIEKFSLNNGLKVVVLPNHRVPAVSHMLWFPTGGADDPYGKSGLAHFHEHVMFRGTENFPAGVFEATVSTLGGDHNAFTSYDTTGYYVNIPKSALPDIMELEADRIRGIRPNDEDIIKERNVIIEERRARTDNNPEALFSEQLSSVMFVRHPYGTPLIGWFDEMNALTKEDVINFHAEHYTINNATLVLAGDITKEEAMPLVKRYYGGLDKGTDYEQRWPKEPPIRANKRLDMQHGQVREPVWQRNYIAPSFGYGDRGHVVPLMVFSQWLGGGTTSYLYQELVVKQKIATSASAFYSGFGIGPETFSVRAVPAKGVSLDKLEAAIDKALSAALKARPSEADIARAKTLLKAETLYAREGLQGVAYIVGWLLQMGLDADYINQWPALVDRATIEDMLKAAQHVLLGEGQVTGTLTPREEK